MSKIVHRFADYATGKSVRDGPEESVRQDFEVVLVDNYGYPKHVLDIEVPIPRGTTSHDRADIVVYRARGRDPAKDIVGIVEVKRPGAGDGKAQLKSYMTATSAEWGVWTNGDTIEYYCKPAGSPSVYDDQINDIPAYQQRLEDIGDLTKQDLVPYGRTELKLRFRHIMHTLYANTNISRREKLGNETMKLIFAKIRDETTFPEQPPAFRVGHLEEPEQVKSRIDTLFQNVVEQLSGDGVFQQHDSITLDPKGVAWVVGQLQRGSLSDTPTDVVGDAFEVFAESKMAGEKGEFFTPGNVIDLAVELIDPQPRETVCDPACGSGRFLISSMRHVWNAMNRRREWRGLRDDQLAKAQQEIASRCFYGIDKETDLVRIAKAYMTISGDGRSNVVHENTLHRADEFNAMAKARFVEGGEFREFDCILTNPPYGTKAKVHKEECESFDLGHRWHQDATNGWRKGTVRESDPYVLFIERCFTMLKADGRLAIVLPETVFHAPTAAHLRHYICERSTLQAVISLPHNSFRPHCNAKTCLLVAKKGVDGPRPDVTMAVPKEMGHDHQGKPIHHPNTLDVWDDIPTVIEEIKAPESKNNAFVFKVPWPAIARAGHLMPSYFDYRRKRRRVPKGRRWVDLGALVDAGVVAAWDGHGSPSATEKGEGEIPYIRVADIVNWELYRNPNSGVRRAVYERMTRDAPAVEPQDILFVRRGSYRIGTVAMASPRDGEVLLTREILTLRVAPNDVGLTPFYLLAMLSSKTVQEQIDHLVFVDTTLPNIGGRWRELKLPVHKDRREMARVSRIVESSIKAKWAAQAKIDTLRDELGELVT